MRHSWLTTFEALCLNQFVYYYFLLDLMVNLFRAGFIQKKKKTFVQEGRYFSPQLNSGLGRQQKAYTVPTLHAKEIALQRGHEGSRLHRESLRVPPIREIECARHRRQLSFALCVSYVSLMLRREVYLPSIRTRLTVEAVLCVSAA